MYNPRPAPEPQPYAANGLPGAVMTPRPQTTSREGLCGSDGCCTHDDSSTMSWVGNGRGEYKAVTTYQYVGRGAGEFTELPKQSRVLNCCCCCLGVLFSLALVALLTWVLQERFGLLWPNPSQPFDCNVGLESSWEVRKKDWCCANAGKGCLLHVA
mmetsp:Transcript_17131/g.47175  ORF Transcript_17131/g.47175 Transcript_17131/m.47175 type:complete len:156 (-) Transcript_17131:117-584(-)